MTVNELKEEFIDIYRTNIKREGADKLLEYLLSGKSDFFTLLDRYIRTCFNTLSRSV